MKYDFLIVGSGLFGATFAYRARMNLIWEEMFIAKKLKASTCISMEHIYSIPIIKRCGTL